MVAPGPVRVIEAGTATVTDDVLNVTVAVPAIPSGSPACGAMVLVTPGVMVAKSSCVVATDADAASVAVAVNVAWPEATPEDPASIP
ncbi:MAG: hypothetical protein ACYC3Q_06225, partial [Gemmatimonadaceae bacterium]